MNLCDNLMVPYVIISKPCWVTQKRRRSVSSNKGTKMGVMLFYCVIISLLFSHSGKNYTDNYYYLCTYPQKSILKCNTH